MNEKQSLLTARFGIVVIGFLSILLASYEKGIMELEWLGCNFWDPIVLAPLTIGFLKFRTNSKSFIVAITVAILSTAISGYIVGDLATISLMCGMIGSAVGLFGMHYWQVHQGTLSVNTQPTQFTETAIDKDTDIGSKALAESQSIHMIEAVEEKTASIVDELREKAFIKGIEKGRLEGKEEVARNLLLQGFEIGIIESVTGLSREDLAALQKSIKAAN